MTPAGTDNINATASRAPSVIILGADALVAAAPATPVQLAHACMRAGYQNVVPSSWGDELIATAVLTELAAHDRAPAIQCSCPLVARRLLSLSSDLSPCLVSLVSPPVAVARYVRALHRGAPLRITYVGRCPGAIDDDIDARMTPEELLTTLTDRHIVLDEQPLVFDSVIPPDRRRYRSEPGGVPTASALWTEGGRRELVEISSPDIAVDVAQLLLGGASVLIDIAPHLGCFCSGASAHGGSVNSAEIRTRVAALEPPRSSTPVIDERLAVTLKTMLPPPAPAAQSPRPAAEVPTPVPYTARADLSIDMRRSESAAGVPATPPAAVSRAPLRHEERSSRSESVVENPPTGRRRSPGQGLRSLTAGTPVARDAEGRQLPRAYVARRRSSPRGLRAVPTETPPDVRPTYTPLAEAARAPEVARMQAPRSIPADVSADHVAKVLEPNAGVERAALTMRQVVILSVGVALLVLVSSAVGVLLGRSIPR